MANATGSGSGWLPDCRDPTKRPRRAGEGDGSPLPDEILLGIFAAFPEIADLVRCAATCRRWRRLVSSVAAFIISCRSSRRRHGPCPGGGRFLPLLALGFFFHQHEDAAAATRFVPMASASRRFPGLQSPSPSPLLDSSSCIVASRNGLVVVDLCRGGKRGRALRLCVCNPMTGEAHALPPLAGKDGLGHYACTVLTANDYHDGTDPPPPSPSSYRLLLLYIRRGFTAFRSYSDDSGCWSPEAKVTGARLGKQQMGLMRNGVVAPGGLVAYWLAKDVVFALRLDTMEASVLRAQSLFDMDDVRLGFTPEGKKLCAVQLDSSAINTATYRRLARVRIITYGRHGGNNEWWKRKEDIWIESFSMDNDTTLKMRWFCERSGIVFFTADHWVLGGDWIREVYAFSIRTRTLDKVASKCDESGADLWGDFFGYEMDQAAYLASLADQQEG